MQALSKGKTLSYTFMLPLLYGQNKQELSKYLKYIHNVYIGEDNTIYCVDRSNKAIYSPKIDTKYINEYNLFIEGKYSKFSTYFKLLVVKFWYGNDELINVLFRSCYNCNTYLINSIDKEFLNKPIRRFEYYKH